MAWHQGKSSKPQYTVSDCPVGKVSDGTRINDNGTEAGEDSWGNQTCRELSGTSTRAMSNQGIVGKVLYYTIQDLNNASALRNPRRTASGPSVFVGFSVSGVWAPVMSLKLGATDGGSNDECVSDIKVSDIAGDALAALEPV